jgi:hypothetical protein
MRRHISIGALHGPAKATRYLTHCRIAPSKTVGGLSERQRQR